MKIRLIISAIVIGAATGVGLYYQFFSKTIDSPVEQVAEQVLRDNGIDVDFSASKKENKDE
jgi:hypothetical protein